MNTSSQSSHLSSNINSTPSSLISRRTEDCFEFHEVNKKVEELSTDEGFKRSDGITKQVQTSNKSLQQVASEASSCVAVKRNDDMKSDEDIDDDDDDNEDNRMKIIIPGAIGSMAKCPAKQPQTNMSLENSFSECSVDYGYDEHETNEIADAACSEGERHHYRRRNSCLINKEQNLLVTLVESGSLLGGKCLSEVNYAEDGPPRMSDKDLDYERERKAALVIAMYNQ